MEISDVLQRDLRKGFIKLIASFLKQSWTYLGELMCLQKVYSSITFEISDGTEEFRSDKSNHIKDVI